MQSALLSLFAAAGVAAQHVTLPAQALVVAAIDPADPQYTVCSAANELLSYCVSSIGGTDAVLTADPTAILNCACCAEETALSPLFSVCSTYLSDEAPSYSTQYSAYGDLYSLCGENANCGSASAGSSARSGSSETASGSSATGRNGGGGGAGGSSGTPRTSSFPTATSSSDDQSTITSSPATQTYATACEDMIGIFTSCTNKVDGFTDLPFGEQASCYCCRTGRNGRLSWTDALDDYASTCADWAVTGEPNTAYSVAETFATFCENFTEVCDVTATTSDGATSTSDDFGAQGSSASGSSDDRETVTVTPSSAAAASQTSNAAPGLRAGCGAVVGAIGALVAAL
ncbi:hypothetical protein G7046_g4333 [Stylonectria norvegica]|nr:hypothetical protein G7046_g4333 [Stylonectria norvegica]